jgi:hypothetical protein
MSNSKDYYRMRSGQAGFDPTDNGEPQSIFDAMAMDFGAPKSSVVTTKTDEKGVTESEVILGKDGKKTTSSLFTPSLILESARQREDDVMNRMDDINANMKPADIGLSPQPEGSGKLLLDADGAVSRRHMGENGYGTAARAELIFRDGIDELYPSFGVSGSGDLVERGELQAESIFEQGAGGMAPYQREYESSGATHTMPDGTVMPGATHRDNALRGEESAESIFEQGAGGMEYAGDGVATGSGDLAPRGEEIAEGLNATDVQVIAQSAAGTEALWELDEDIKAANGDDNAIAAAGEEFMDGIRDLAEYDPQLVKSLFTMASAMMMGESFGDAMATGFGVVEEAAMVEEAADKARGGQVIDMLINNAEHINDSAFWATLEEFNLSDKEKESVATKWSLAKYIADKTKLEVGVAEAAKSLKDFTKETIDGFTNVKNKSHLTYKIDNFLTYAQKQLFEQAKPGLVYDGMNEDMVQEAVGKYAERYDYLTEVDQEWSRAELDKLKRGGIEAVWEGLRGSYSMSPEGVLSTSVLIPEQQEPVYVAIKMILGLNDWSAKETNKWLGEKHRFWEDNFKGTINNPKKNIPYHEDYDKVTELGMLSTQKASEVGYIGWLLQEAEKSRLQ